MLEYLDKAHFGNLPKVEIDADGVTRYRGEADDCKLGILHRRRQLLLPTVHMEEIVNFLVDKEKEGRGTT